MPRGQQQRRAPGKHVGASELLENAGNRATWTVAARAQDSPGCLGQDASSLCLMVLVSFARWCRHPQVPGRLHACRWPCFSAAPATSGAARRFWWGAFPVPHSPAAASRAKREPRIPRLQMLEPRRLAAKAAARRLAALHGSKVGDVVGFRVRHETAVSSATRIEVRSRPPRLL